MKKAACLMLMASGLGKVCLAGEANWPVRHHETVHRILQLSGAPLRVVIENVQGYVHVAGSQTQQVDVTAYETTRAQTDTDLRQAQSEVKLNMLERPGTVSVTYDAPWICRNGQHHCGDNERRFYEVQYDLDIRIPVDAIAVVSTVNSGDVVMAGLKGDFEVNNVNGNIRLDNMSGSGSAHTVNGPVTVRFLKNPERASSFRSVNGNLDVYFRQELSASLRFKTLNGEVYSDFDVVPKPVRLAATERSGGKFVYRNDRGSEALAGGGGPEISFDTLNGNIRLHREDKETKQ